MMTDWIRRVMTRDLTALGTQIEAYANEGDIWRLVPGIGNSAGTLALHIAGNIQHYIGAQFGGTGYVRDRDAEFTTRGVPRAQLLELVARADSALQVGFDAIDDGVLDDTYPLDLGGVTLSTGQTLLHLAAHLAYHVGQVDYHRRIVTGAGAVAGMQSTSKLVD
ncbi:MAG: DUF1572 domain-containing protein [Gemmatimonadetes bacterium]|nr:DUF1572 domain-containing protein [Gemmatimonadota bacterium]NIO32675.1 DUF1572 domain-containing protein [Gemmatimonadota bacterium]